MPPAGGANDGPAAVVCLVTGIILLQKNIASYVAGHYHEYARDVNGTRYQCTGSPEQVHW
ncbi:hypothetical protein MAHJHV57_49880 [Mycobacterium avium subsp. hominissuis]